MEQNSTMGNPTQFPQLSSLSSRAKQLSRGTPDSLISFERKTTVIVHADSLKVGSLDPVSISGARSEIETQRIFLNLLEQEMSKWPEPPRGFRWVPGFKFVVAPGGNQNAFRLELVAKELSLRAETSFSMGQANSGSNLILK